MLKDIFRLMIVLSTICGVTMGIAAMQEVNTVEASWEEILSPTIAEVDYGYLLEHGYRILEDPEPEPIQAPEFHSCEAIITAYCSCQKCCGRWALNRPNGVVYTSTGAVAQAGVTIAVDPNVIPYGSHVVIDGHEYIAQDTGSGLRGSMPHIDIYCDSHQEALQIGRQTKPIIWWEG